MMEIWGGQVHPSPSDVTDYGKQLLAQDPDHPGSLGIAISEAVAEAVEDPSIRYALGSVLNHVLLHQTIIGEEALLQLAKVDETPDVLVGCTGGGSNFGGLAFPFLREKLAGKMNPTIRCVEPAACRLTKGEYRYDFETITERNAHTRCRSRAHPRMALLRYGATGMNWGWWKRSRFPRPSVSKARCSLPAQRASCLHRNLLPLSSRGAACKSLVKKSF